MKLIQILSTVRFLPISIKFFGTAKFLIVAALTLVLQSTIFADDGSRLGSLKQLCISDKGTGFNWENGSWMSVNFTEEKFVVSKVDVPKEASELSTETFDAEAFVISVLCNEDVFQLSEEQTDGDNMRAYRSCLKLQTLGEKDPKYLACTESHLNNKEGGNDWNVRFHCRGILGSSFYMQDGYFHLGHVHGAVSTDPENDYKDSLYILVGKCVSIED